MPDRGLEQSANARSDSDFRAARRAKEAWSE